MNKSPLGTLNSSDWLHGLIMTIGTPIVSGIILLLTNLVNSLSGGQAINLPSIKVQLLIIGLTGVTAGLTYILKKLSSNSQNQFLTKEPTTPPASQDAPVSKVN